MSKATLTSSPDQAPLQASKPSSWRNIMNKYLRPAVVLTLLLTVLTGVIYPGIVTALAQLLFHDQANGSLRYANGQVVGSAIGLQLLFNIPLFWGCIITALDVLMVLWLQNKGFRWIEAMVSGKPSAWPRTATPSRRSTRQPTADRARPRTRRSRPA